MACHLVVKYHKTKQKRTQIYTFTEYSDSNLCPPNCMAQCCHYCWVTENTCMRALHGLKKHCDYVNAHANVKNIHNLTWKHVISTLLTHSPHQSCKHVNSCDIAMRRESLPAAPISAPVSPPATPAWPHLPAIMNCHHSSLPHLYRPFSLFSSLRFSPHFIFPSASHTVSLISLNVKHS